MVMGHEASGRVVAVGEGVTHLQVGEGVVEIVHVNSIILGVALCSCSLLRIGKLCWHDFDADKGIITPSPGGGTSCDQDSQHPGGLVVSCCLSLCPCLHHQRMVWSWLMGEWICGYIEWHAMHVLHSTEQCFPAMHK